MSAIVKSQTTGLNADFWDLLDRIEGQHRRVQSEYDRLRRQLDRVDPKVGSEFRDTWVRYCDVIAELERAAADLERLRLSGP